ncbi:MAG: PilZ domain-containing protein [Acidobacteriota bacterium]|nr:PilZ domain-containing protein [Acidobacteriota bacterium]
MKAKQDHLGTAASRAHRFPIEAPIRFRGIYESAWRDGLTRNVSRTGVLFWCDRALKKGARVKIGLALPGSILSENGGEVECHGRIVRVEPPRNARAEYAVAATFASYRFVRAGTGRVAEANATRIPPALPGRR